MLALPALASMTALNQKSSPFCFGSPQPGALFCCHHSFGSHSICQITRTRSPKRVTIHLWIQQPKQMVLLPHSHHLHCQPIFHLDWSFHNISIGAAVIHCVFMVWPCYHWTVFALSLMAVLTPTSFAAILALSLIAVITIMCGLFPHSSLRCVMASPIICGITSRSQTIGLSSMPLFQLLLLKGSLITSIKGYVQSATTTLRFFTQAIHRPGCACSSFCQWHHRHGPTWLPEMDTVYVFVTLSAIPRHCLKTPSRIYPSIITLRCGAPW